MKPIAPITRRLRMRDLQLLRAVAELGSMARAAEAVGLSQPAVTKVISDLEKDLGAPLFTRSPRGTEATEVGKVLLRRGRNIIDELNQGLLEIETLSDPTAGEVRLGIIEAWAPFVSAVVNRIARRYPRIVFTISVDFAEQLVGALRDRELDIVVARKTMVQRERDLLPERLFDDRLVVVCGRNHPLASRRKVTIDDLTKERWALGPSDTYLGLLLAEAFRRQKRAMPKAIVTSNSVQMRMDLLKDGQFLSVHSSAMLRQVGQAQELKALPVDLDDAAGPMAAITLRSRHLHGALKLVLDEMRSVGKALS